MNAIIIKRITGWCIVLNILPVICMCIEFFNHKEGGTMLMAYAAGLFLSAMFVLLFALGYLIAWLLFED